MLEEEIDNILQKYVGVDIPGVAVGVVKNQTIVYMKAFGYSDVDKKTPMTVDTIQEAGSVTQIFTWTALMQLAEKKLIALDDDIRPLFSSDSFDLTFDEPITPLHLMNHTAGFEERYGGIVSDYTEILPFETFMQLNNQPKQIWRPGERMSDSHYAASLAGLVVSKLANMPYEDYIREHILTPLTIENACVTVDYTKFPDIVAHKGYGYLYDMPGKFIEQVPHYINDMPAGSLQISVRDLTKFAMAHLNCDQTPLFNSTETLHAMHQFSHRQHEKIPGSAHGFWTNQRAGTDMLACLGHTMGYTTQIVLVPSKQLSYVIMCNRAYDESGLIEDLANYLVGKKEVSSGKTDSIEDSGRNKKIEGIYTSASAVYSNLFSLLPYVNKHQLSIEAMENEQVMLQLGTGEKKYYEEVSPYLYQRVDDHDTDANKKGETDNYMYFTEENDRITSMTHGTIMDYLPVPLKRKEYFVFSWLLATLILAAVGLITSFSMKNPLLLEIATIMISASVVGVFFILNHVYRQLSTNICRSLRQFEPYVLMMRALVAIGIVCELASVIMCFVWMKKPLFMSPIYASFVSLIMLLFLAREFNLLQTIGQKPHKEL